ncbi:hypothetical protein VTP01DRAFT_5415 [Rhizomucor pusillus]|uniref:uncharacterized protein n=1 Tax=Rhizomucor pusillus TaxID=4840 RepID=UPI0037437EF2
MTLISQAAQEYEENVRNHITANMVKKTQEYIFVRLTDENDEILRHCYGFREEGFGRSYPMDVPNPTTHETKNIHEEKPQDYVSKGFVHRQISEILSKANLNLFKGPFNSLKQSVYDSIQKQEPPKLSKSFTRPLLEESMEALQTPMHADFRYYLFTRNRSPYKADDLHDAYFNLFDMSKIGHSTLESLDTDTSLFWDKIRTDGYDVEFIFKKLKRPPLKAPLEPDDINSKFLKETAIWGVDPGLTDIFVAADEFYR